ncbi:MAG: 2-amino-4-hydroxy-6-hydroxymethyldihydropteridine diphosphokinase [Polyangiaceae bacterium]
MKVVVGLGANLGDRLASLQAAVDALARIASVALVSSVYESAPVGGPPQPEFLNAAVLLRWDRTDRPHHGIDKTAADLLALLAETQAIERALGRLSAERWGPRAIDLDILWAEGAIVANPRLTVPHPRLTERAFALVPLLEVCPGCIDPRTNAPLDASATDRTSVVFYGALRG